MELKKAKQIGNEYLEGESTYSLAKKYNLNNETIGYNLKKQNIKLRSRSKYMKLAWTSGRRSNTKFWMVPFIPLPTPELSYILGVRYGDIRLMRSKKNNSYSVGLIAKDIDFVNKFKVKINKVLNKVLSSKVWQEKKGYYGYSVYSKKLYEYLKLPFKKHKKVISRYPIEFLRGAYDSEGSIGKRKKIISFSSYNLVLLNYIKRLLSYLGIIVHIYYSNRKDNKPEYNLTTTKQIDGRLFMNKIGFTIERKKDVWKMLYKE